MPYISNPPGSQDRVTELNDVTITSIASNEVLKWNGSAWINQTLSEANVLTVAGPTFTGVLTVGSAVISEADLEQIDDLTAGTAVASKALVVDSNKDIGTIRNLTIDGIFTDGNYTFATDGNVTGLGTVASGTHTIGSLVVAAASITDTSGAITFGNENLSTTGTLAAGTTTSGTISFGNENLTTSGVVTAGGITLGSAVLIEAELEMLDGKAVVLDSSTNITGIGTIGSAAITSSGVITGTGFTIGSAVIVESELEMIDGITAGTAAASKALVLDSSTNITGIGTIGAGAITSSGVVTGTGFTIGSAVIVESELEMIDGITAGTAAASKAVVLDSSTNITGIGTIGSGAITSSGIVTGTGFTAGSAVLAEAELELLDGLTAGTAIASKVVTTDGSIDTTGQRNLTITGELDAATLDISGVVDIAGVTDLHGTLDMNSQDIDNIKSATFIAVVDNGSSGSSKTIDWGAGQKQKVTMTANCTFTFTAPDGPCNLMLILIQDGGGTNTAVWTGGSTNVDFPAATVPTLTTTGSAVDVIAFFYDGTNANGTYYAQATLAFG